MPDDFGGNMDTPEMRAGRHLLPRRERRGRAVLSLGDGHARQGEGETCGTAVEGAMDVTVLVDLIKGGRATPWPRLENDDVPDVHRLGRGRSRTRSGSRTSRWCSWVAELTGMTVLDAYQLVSQTALTPVANVVDTAYTVVAKVAKAHLPGVVAMDGVHARLRKQAGAWAG